MSDHQNSLDNSSAVPPPIPPKPSQFIANPKATNNARYKLPPPAAERPVAVTGSMTSLPPPNTQRPNGDTTTANVTSSHRNSYPAAGSTRTYNRSTSPDCSIPHSSYGQKLTATGHKLSDSPLLKHHSVDLTSLGSYSSSPAHEKSADCYESQSYEEIGITRHRLSNLIANPSTLPMRVAFCDSIYGFVETFTFFSQDQIDIHFMKETRFAIVETSTEKTLKVPLQAPFQFTLDQSFNALTNVDYKPSQLLKLSYLPKVAVVKNSGRLNHQSKSSKFTNGEVLALTCIKSNTIECFSIQDKARKIMHKSSELVLTVNPSQVVIDFVDLIFFNLPLEVHINVDACRHQSKLQPAFSNSSLIMGLAKEKSLIASYPRDTWERDDIEKAEIYEIFSDIPIDFQKVHMQQSVTDLLNEKTKRIYENFQPSCVSMVLSCAASTIKTKENLCQQWLNEIITYTGNENEQWKYVVKLYRPDNAYQQTNSCQTTAGLPQLSTRPQPKRVTVHQTARPIPVTTGQSTPPPPLSNKSREGYMPLTRPMTPTLPRSSMLYTVPFGTPLLKSFSMESVDSSGIFVPMNFESAKCIPKTKLAELSCDQVLQLLDKLGLPQYKELFAKERIAGRLFEQLDGEILEHELGVTSKLHRLKLLQVIQGKKPLELYFS